MSKLVKRIALGSALAVFLLIFFCTTLTRIDVGHIGVKVKLAGSGRGVQQDMQIKTGWVFFNPFTEQVVEFPVSVQNIILSADKHEGNGPKDKDSEHGHDESITFSSLEGVNANADIGFSFHIDPQQAPQLYSRFRQTDMRELAYSYMRNVLREAFNDVASKMPIQEIYGAGKSKMIADVTERCRVVLGKDGVIIDQLTINGALRLPQNVADAINNAMAATQNAIQSENKVRQIKAEAEQAIAASEGAAEAVRKKAQGDADAQIIAAEADAKAVLMSADAEAKANRTINASLTPDVLRNKTITKWNGTLPTVMSGATPFVSIPR